jgi:Ca2+-binding EF-hand superfamily protein
LVNNGHKCSQAEADVIFDAIKQPGEYELSWSSFLYACMINNESTLNEETLRKVFDFLDSDIKGSVSDEDMKNSLIRRGHIFKLSSREAVSVDEVLKMAGFSEEKKTIDFEEFA